MSVSTFLYMLLAPFLVRFALYKTLLYVEALLLVKGGEKVCQSTPGTETVYAGCAGDLNRQHASSSSKNAYPSLRASVGAASRLYAISRSDLQCFSHEDGCFAAESELQEQPA